MPKEDERHKPCDRALRSVEETLLRIEKLLICLFAPRPRVPTRLVIHVGTPTQERK